MNEFKSLISNTDLHIPLSLNFISISGLEVLREDNREE